MQIGYKIYISGMFEKNLDKKIFMLTPPIPRIKYDNKKFYEEIIKIVEKIYQNVGNDNCIFIRSEEFEDKTTYVTTDIIHPSTEGHMIMGYNLAKIIEKYL